MEDDGGPQERQKQRSNRRRWILTGGAAVVSLVTLVLSAGLFIRSHTSPLPKSIRQNAIFPLYYPQPMPPGFKADMAHASYDKTVGLLLVPFTNNNQHHITLSEQSLPGNIKFEDLQGQGTVIDGAQGQAAISNVEERNVVSLIPLEHKTLVLLNSSDATRDEMIDLTRALHLLNK